jgi:hypothetical protein
MAAAHGLRHVHAAHARQDLDRSHFYGEKSAEQKRDRELRLNAGVTAKIAAADRATNAITVAPWGRLRRLRFY